MSYNNNYGSGGGGYGGGGGGGYGGGGAARYQGRNGDDQYLERSQKVTGNIFTINKNVMDIQKFVGYIGTPRDTPELRDRLHQIQEQTRGVVRDTSQALKQLAQLDGGSQSEQRERRMQQEKLSKDFKSVLAKFQTTSQTAISKERETVHKKPGQGPRGGGQYSYNDEYDERTTLIENQQRAQMEQMDNQIDYSSSIIADREEAIKEIESTMTEVNEIYRDLSTLVVEQGHQLDNIEANMSSADANVDHGAQQLSSASRYQKKARNKMCCMLVILAAVLAVVVVIVVTQTKKKD